MFNYASKIGLPVSWNIMLLKSLYKNRGDKLDPNNYRGISISGTWPKLYSMILNDILEQEAKTKKLRATN